MLDVSLSLHGCTVRDNRAIRGGAALFGMDATLLTICENDAHLCAHDASRCGAGSRTNSGTLRAFDRGKT